MVIYRVILQGNAMNLEVLLNLVFLFNDLPFVCLYMHLIRV